MFAVKNTAVTISKDYVIIYVSQHNGCKHVRTYVCIVLLYCNYTLTVLTSAMFNDLCYWPLARYNLMLACVMIINHTKYIPMYTVYHLYHQNLVEVIKSFIIA